MPYTTSQNRAISDFRAVTGVDSKAAAKWLKSASWDQTVAVNAYFRQSSNVASPAASSKDALQKLFDMYRNPRSDTPDQLDIEEIMPYFSAIGADPEALSALVAQEIMKCPEMGTITRDGFVDGWSRTGCDTVEKQKKYLKSRTGVLGQPGNKEALKSVYKHAFELCITGAGQRLVSKDELCALWQLLFSAPGLDWKSTQNNWLELWLDFVQSNSAKSFNRDVWTQTLRFAEETLKDETLGFWSEESSWPAVIDEFVEWVKEKRGASEGAVIEEDEEMEY